MLYIDFYTIRYEEDYYRMIGYKCYELEMAYNEFMKFLKEYKIIGDLRKALRDYFGSYAQLYRYFFIVRTSTIRSKMSEPKSNSATFTNYCWYEDVALLFPFTYFERNNDTWKYSLNSYWRTVFDMWKDHCLAQKIYHSEIKREDKEYETNNLIYGWYFPHSTINLER